MCVFAHKCVNVCVRAGARACARACVRAAERRQLAVLSHNSNPPRPDPGPDLNNRAQHRWRHERGGEAPAGDAVPQQEHDHVWAAGRAGGLLPSRELRGRAGAQAGAVLWLALGCWLWPAWGAGWGLRVLRACVAQGWAEAHHMAADQVCRTPAEGPTPLAGHSVQPLAANHVHMLLHRRPHPNRPINVPPRCRCRSNSFAILIIRTAARHHRPHSSRPLSATFGCQPHPYRRPHPNRPLCTPLQPLPFYFNRHYYYLRRCTAGPAAAGRLPPQAVHDAPRHACEPPQRRP